MNGILDSVISILPPDIGSAIKEYNGRYTEIRLRKNRHVALCCYGKNTELSAYTDEKTLSECVDALCSHSLYTHMHTIAEGYIQLGSGVRVGVCGRAVCDGDRIKHISEITGLNIRIPIEVPGVAREIYSQIKKGGFLLSLLIFSPPNLGKTTLLRDLAQQLAVGTYGKKVVIIDSRCEIETDRLSRCSNIDIMSGYPKDKAIEIATRTLSAEYILCDEIGGLAEAESLLSVQNCGVPVVATAHASSIEELLTRKNIRILHDSGFFRTYVRILRMNYGSPPTLEFYDGLRNTDIPDLNGKASQMREECPQECMCKYKSGATPYYSQLKDSRCCGKSDIPENPNENKKQMKSSDENESNAVLNSGKKFSEAYSDKNKPAAEGVKSREISTGQASVCIYGKGGHGSGARRRIC